MAVGVPGGGRCGCLGLLLDLPLEEAAALGLVDDLHVVVDGHVRPVRRVAVVLGTSCREKGRNNYLTQILRRIAYCGTLPFLRTRRLLKFNCIF